MARNYARDSLLLTETVYDKCWNLDKSDNNNSVRLWYNHIGRRYDYLPDKFDFSKLKYSKIATDCEKIRNHCGIYGVDETVNINDDINKVDYTIVKKLNSLIYNHNYGYYISQDFSKMGMYMGRSQYILYDHTLDRVYIIFFKHI